MNADNTNEIMAIDPIFYREKDMNCQQTAMCWGLECGDGWKEPLLNLARKTNILNSMLRPYNLCIVGKQVKSKWADLRVYWDMMPLDEHLECSVNEEEEKNVNTIYKMMEDAVNAAELECEWTCEECGYHGNEYADDIVTCGSWMTHYCRTCAQKNQRIAGEITNYQHGFEFLSPFEKGNVYDGDIKYGCFLGLYYCKLKPEFEKIFKYMENPREVQEIAVEMELPEANDHALKIMREALEIKFKNNRMQRLLLDTGNLNLNGMNNCHENYWGGCICQKCKDVPHLNNYGKLLMDVRSFYKKDEKNEI